jgi:hypothetical protein
MNTSMHELSLPGVAQVRLRLTRDQLLLLFVAFNLAFLVLDVYVAHSVNAFRPVYEWIPIITSWPGVLTSLWLAFRERPGTLSRLVHLAAMLLNVVVGVMGTAFHLRAVTPPGGGWAWAWICFGAPVLAPLSFAGVGLVGLWAVLREEPPGSGILSLPGVFRLRAPLSKTQHLLWFVALGFGGAAATSFVDHGQYGYTWAEWIPVATGLFATLVVIGRAVVPRPSDGDTVAYLWTMVLSIVVGVAGFAFHLSRDLADTGAMSLERMRALAPIFAPGLFVDLGILGLLVILSDEHDARTVNTDQP